MKPRKEGAVGAKPLRILIADDHSLVRDMMAVYLRDLDDNAEVTHAATLQEAGDAARTSGPFDLIFLDLRMPGMNGLAGLKMLKSQVPDTPVVIISGDVNPDLVRGALSEGAVGYIPKTMRARAMLGAIRLVLSGGRYIPEILATEAAPARPGKKAGQQGGIADLTPREREVMGYLVKGVTNKEIGRDLNIEEITVALHLRSIFKKLGVTNRTQAVRHALDLGWDR